MKMIVKCKCGQELAVRRGAITPLDEVTFEVEPCMNNVHQNCTDCEDLELEKKKNRSLMERLGIKESGKRYYKNSDIRPSLRGDKPVDDSGKRQSL